MTSQKRYRYNEASTNSTRYRDLPPRFKRQKSNSSPKPEGEVQEKPSSDICAKEARNPSVSLSSTAMAPLPSNNSGQNANLNNQDYSRRMGSSPSPLSPNMDNFYSNPPASPGMMRPSGRAITPAFAPIDVGPPVCWGWPPFYANGQTPPMYYHQPLVPMDNNIVPPALAMSSVKSQDLGMASLASPPAKPDNHPPGAVHNPPPDFSDPDIRTIEMLRELERVADEKEKEDENDPTVDRKNLVSHHLRMLMCAVDRYTEGVDQDDGYESSECTASKARKNHQQRMKLAAPPPSPPRAHRPSAPTPDQAQLISEQKESVPWQTIGPRKQKSRNSSPPPKPRSTPMSPANHAPAPRDCLTPSPYMQQAVQTVTKFAIHQGIDNQPAEVSNGTVPPVPWLVLNPWKASPASWNMWSGPSFNIADMYKPPNEVVDSFAIAESMYPIVTHGQAVFNKGHLPLYKR